MTGNGRVTLGCTFVQCGNGNKNLYQKPFILFEKINVAEEFDDENRFLRYFPKKK